MSRTRIIVVAAIVGLAMVMFIPMPASSNEVLVVTICRIPPGNPDLAHTITVGESDLNAHLRHADTLGPCELDGIDLSFDEFAKVTICHVPLGNPYLAHTLSVPVEAVPNHLRHGDHRSMSMGMRIWST